MPQSSITPLSSGSLNGQTLKVELHEPGSDLPNAVVIVWPPKPTITSQPNDHSELRRWIEAQNRPCPLSRQPAQASP